MAYGSPSWHLQGSLRQLSGERSPCRSLQGQKVEGVGENKTTRIEVSSFPVRRKRSVILGCGLTIFVPRAAYVLVNMNGGAKHKSTYLL